MRRFVGFAAAVTFLSVSVGRGQHLEANIFVPDSFGGLREPRLVTHNPVTGQVFVSGRGGNIVVLDAATGRRAGAVWADTCLTMLCDTIRNMLYAAAYEGEKIYAVDGSTRRVVAEMEVGHGPARLCINRAESKLYCVNQGSFYEEDSTLTVMDLSTNAVVANVVVGSVPADVCWSPAVNKVYCSAAGDSSIRVLDGATDSIVGTIELGRSAARLFCVPGGERVYAMGSGGIDVVDVRGDTVIGHIGTADALEYCLAPGAGKLYVGGHDRVDAIDISTDSVVRRFGNLRSVLHLCHHPGRNRVYAAQTYWHRGIAVIDAVADSIVDTIPVTLSDETGSLCCDAPSDRIYLTGAGASVVGVIDCGADTLLSWISTLTSLKALTCVGRTDRLYCSEGVSRRVFVFDGSDYHKIAEIGFPGEVSRLCHDPARGRLLASQYDRTSVAFIDESGDSVSGWLELDLPVHDLQLDTVNRLLYAWEFTPDDVMAIVDADRDSVIAQFEVCDALWEALPVPQQNKLFVMSDRSVLVVSGELLRLTTRIPLGGYVHDICANMPGTRVYAAVRDDSVVAVIDAEHNQLLRLAHIGAEPGYVCHDPVADRVFCSCRESEEVVVLDATTDSVVAHVPVGSYPGGMVCCPGIRQVYCIDRTDRTATAIDADDFRVLAVVRLSSTPRDLACSADESRVYVRTDLGISVISTATGVSEPAVDGSKSQLVGTSLVRGRLMLRGSKPAILFDITGSRVMSLRPGENDIRGVVPGVYFLREDSRIQGPTGSSVRKVVIPR